MTRSRVLAAVLLSVSGFALASCGGKTTDVPADPAAIPADAGRPGLDAAAPGADAAEPGPDASTADAGPSKCGNYTVPKGRNFTVSIGGMAIDFSGTDFSSGHDTNSQFYDFGSLDGNYVLSTVIYDDFTKACPASYKLPTDQAPIGLYLYSIDVDGNYTLLYDTDEAGSTGTLTLDGFGVVSKKEEVSWKCPSCTLGEFIPKPDTDGGTGDGGARSDGGGVAPPILDGGTGTRDGGGSSDAGAPSGDGGGRSGDGGPVQTGDGGVNVATVNGEAHESK